MEESVITNQEIPDIVIDHSIAMRTQKSWVKINWDSPIQSSENAWAIEEKPVEAEVIEEKPIERAKQPEEKPLGVKTMEKARATYPFAPTALVEKKKEEG